MLRCQSCYFILALVLVLGCGKTLPEQEWKAEIEKYEKEKSFDLAIASIEGFVEHYKESQYRPIFLKKLALLHATTRKDFKRAIMVYRQIIAEVNDANLVAQAQFMAGYIYANEIRDFDSAKVEYNAFLKAYPKHELVASVKWELENLGKDISEFDIAPDEKMSNGSKTSKK